MYSLASIQKKTAKSSNIHLNKSKKSGLQTKKEETINNNLSQLINNSPKVKQSLNNSFSVNNYPIQKKLKIGNSEDKFEKEADMMAEKVMNSPHTSGNSTQKQEEEKPQAKEMVNRQEEEEPQAKEIVNHQEEEEPQAKEIVNRREEEEPQAKEIVNRQEEEEPQAKEIVNHQEEEEPQTKEIVNRQEEEEPQTKEIVNRQEEEEIQTKEIVNRQEEEEPQAKEIVNRQEEEEPQAKEMVNRQEEEEPQAKEIVNRQEEEEPQAKEIVNRQEEEPQAKFQVQPKSKSSTQGSNETQINISKAGGQPLGRSVRNFMEPRFGTSFEGVKTHTDQTAIQMNKQIGAQAFTYGNHIYFGNDKFNPGTSSGKRLLAHELTHVVQQGKGSPLNKKKSANPQNKISKSSVSNGKVQTLPLITGINSQGEIGVGRSMSVSATVAGNPRINWSFVGAPPAGVTIRGGRRRARINASNIALPGAGANFSVRATLASNATDTFTSNPITIVGITNIAFTPNPAFQTPVPALIPATGPANTVEPNARGVAGNTANTVITSAPGGAPSVRPMTVTLRRRLGGSIAGLVITPGSRTGNIRVRVTDNATGTRRDENLPVNPFATRLRGFTAQAAAPAPYGVLNTLRFASSHGVPAASFNRIVGEAMTNGGRDDFNIMPTFNGIGPNPAPILNLAVPANTWQDQLRTSAVNPVGATPDNNLMNVNRYVGPGVAARLPRVTNVRQGFHWISWAGAWSNEFDRGFQRRTLRQTGRNTFGFRTEHIFRGARARPFDENYVSPYVGVASPLIILSNITAVPLAPPARGIAADGVATGRVTVNTTHAGRNVNWSAIRGAISFTVPALGAAQPVGNPAAILAGLNHGNCRVRVQDAVFPNRRSEGNIRLHRVSLSRIRGSRRVAAGVLNTNLTVDAQPGGRNVDWTIDAASAAAGITITPVAVAGPAIAAPVRTAQLRRPNAAFRGTVTVIAADRIRNAARRTVRISFR